MILQRRCLVSTKDINAGDKISDGDMVELRPCPPNGILPAKRLIMVQVITKNISKVRIGDVIFSMDKKTANEIIEQFSK
jgi:sialic acid synthase SpsE